MSALTLIALILLAWVVLSFGLALVAFALGSARTRRLKRLAGMGRSERRVASRDRRVGLPDTREVRIERRSGTDRRHGSALGASG